ALPDAVRIERPAPHRGLVGGQDALHARHHADPGHDAAPEPELRAPGRERRDLEEGRVAVEQQLDALARHELAALAVALDVLRAAPGACDRELLVEEGELLQE